MIASFLLRCVKSRLTCRAKFVQIRIARRVSYSRVTKEDVAHFTGILGSNGVLTGKEVESHNRDWMGRFCGHSNVALCPQNTEQVSQILAYCNKQKLPIVPQGGNSGLSGGSVPVFDEVILLMARMNKITKFDSIEGVLTCQAGCTLSQLNKFAEDKGHLIPLDLGAENCQAGGFVSTNAGGLRFLKYSTLRASVLGLEAVTADGTILNLMQPLRKNNTGYDLKQLFIGGEGTLGMVTAVNLLCPTRPAAVHLAYLACKDYDKLQQMLVQARRQLGEILSAFEFIDRPALEMTTSVMGDRVSNPLPDSSAQFFAIIETAGSNKRHDYEKLQAFLQEMKRSGIASEEILAQSTKEADEIWCLRKSVSVALSTKGPAYKYDLSLPLDKTYMLVETMRERVGKFKDAEVVAFGHLGDGNLHLNISVPAYSRAIQETIEPFVFEYTAAHSGSISAEHGLGQMKNEQIGYSKPAEAVKLMCQLKRMFDPNWILNPYKYLPSQEWPSTIRQHIENKAERG